MTLLVAIKVPTSHLNPLRLPLSFPEPYIVMGADTRFSFSGNERGPIDDAMKVWRVSDSAIAGYSGDVELAERALYSAFSASELQGLGKNPKFMLRAIENYLKYWDSRLRKRRMVFATTVFVGLHKDQKRFELWEMKSELRFSPRRRSGINIAGSGAEVFDPAFRNEIKHYTRNWAAAVKRGGGGEQGNSATQHSSAENPSRTKEIHPVDVGGLVLGAIDSIVSKAGLSDVGGWSRVVVMTESGVFPIYGHVAGSQRRAMSRNDLRGYIPRVAPRQFSAPTINEFGNFTKGGLVQIKFTEVKREVQPE